jgi:hypothetical protein
VRHPIHVFATDWIAKFKTFAFVRSSVWGSSRPVQIGSLGKHNSEKYFGLLQRVSYLDITDVGLVRAADKVATMGMCSNSLGIGTTHPKRSSTSGAILRAEPCEIESAWSMGQCLISVYHCSAPSVNLILQRSFASMTWYLGKRWERKCSCRQPRWWFFYSRIWA